MADRLSAGVYCRISVAKVDDRTKVEDQERICRDLCARLGWDVTEVYADNSRSAWQRNRKRPGWDKMLADVKEGRINAIAVYHGDRLVRHPWDLEVLLDLAEARGVQLASPTGTRDLGNPEDHLVLRIEAAMAKRESDATSRRRKNQYDRWRRSGRVRPGGRGGRAYGFATDGITLIPEECAVIRDAAERVLTGETTGAIARDLTERGHRTPTGGPFSHSTLRKMLARPRYAGLMPDGVHEAAWQPVLDRDTWEAVCAVLGAKAAGYGYTTNARRYLLSGIARCGVCGGRMNVNNRASEGRPSWYRCVAAGCPHRVHRSQPQLDVFVSAAVVAKLNDPANPPGRVPRNAALAAEMRALLAQRAETEAAVADPAVGVHLPLLLRRLSSVDARLAQLRDLAAGSARSRLLASHAGVTRAGFDALPLAARRALVAAVFTVTVLPASKRGPGFRPDDVRLAPPAMP